MKVIWIDKVTFETGLDIWTCYVIRHLDTTTETQYHEAYF